MKPSTKRRSRAESFQVQQSQCRCNPVNSHKCPFWTFPIRRRPSRQKKRKKVQFTLNFAALPRLSSELVENANLIIWPSSISINKAKTAWGGVRKLHWLDFGDKSPKWSTLKLLAWKILLLLVKKLWGQPSSSYCIIDSM